MDQTIIILNIGKTLITLISIIEILLFIRAVVSWFPTAGATKFGTIIGHLTEPILAPFRRLVSRSVIEGNIMLDLSFVVAILILELTRYLISLVTNAPYL